MRPTRVFGYIRVSTDEQALHGTSLDAQRDEVNRHAQREGYPAPVIVSEVESGGAERIEARVKLARLIRDLRAGDVVLVTRVDRWSRDLPHAVASVRELVARGVRWISIGDGADASTMAGMSTLGIMAWSADNERSRIKERTVGRRRQLRDAGCWTEGRAPFGYRRDVTRRLAICEVEAVVVREVYARCIGGESIAKLAADLTARRIARVGSTRRAWDKKAVHQLLTARWYVGEIRRHDGTWAPAHPPLVELDTFDAAARAMASRRLTGRAASEDSRTASWLLRGLARCSLCGSRMGAAYGPDGQTYYVCGRRARARSCALPYARVERVDETVAATAVRRLEELRGELSRADAGAAPADDGRLDALAATCASLKAKRARLVSMAADGDITREELRERVAKVDTDLAHASRSLAHEEALRRPMVAAVRVEVLADVRRLRRAWGRLPVAARRQVVALLADRIEIDGDGPRVQWASAEDLCVAAVGGILIWPTPATRRAA